MGGILEQFGLDITFFYEFGIFFALFLILPFIFFNPFLQLIQARHARTISDQQKAEQLQAQAKARLEEYRTRMAEERLRSRTELERVISEVKAQEAEVLSGARGEAKKLTQSALDSIQQQSASLKRSLEADVEGLALQISDLLMKRQG